MNKIWSLTVRNLKRYYRDNGAFFFSMLSVFIVVGLYIFFLTDMQVDHIKLMSGQEEGARKVVYAWVVGGLLCIPAVSVPLILLSFKVEDLIEGVQEDLFVTPVKRIYIMLGYIFAAWIAGFVMSIITLIFGELFIVLKGGAILSIVSFLRTIGILGLLTLVFSFFTFFVIIFIKSNSALTVVNVILNTLIGFLTGLYVPIGYLSEGIATVIKIFPLSHAAALLRQTIMKESMKQAFEYIPKNVVDEVRQNYGVDLIIGKHVLTTSEMLLSLLGFGLLFFMGSLVLLNRSKRN